MPLASLTFVYSDFSASVRGSFLQQGPVYCKVTAEEFANRLDRQASKSKGKTGEVMINVDVIETILLETWLQHRRLGCCRLGNQSLLVTHIMAFPSVHLRRIQACRRMANL